MSKIIKVDEEDYANGPGVRVVLWFSGCTHKCPGCHNPRTEDFTLGEEVDDDLLERVRDLMDETYISGISLSGGDPFHPDNVEDALRVAEYIGTHCVGKTIWAWTGYKLSQLPKEVLDCKHINVIVDGKYVESLKDPSLKYRGSSNQKIWNHLGGEWKDVTDRIDPSSKSISIKEV